MNVFTVSIAHQTFVSERFKKYYKMYVSSELRNKVKQSLFCLLYLVNWQKRSSIDAGDGEKVNGNQLIKATLHYRN